MADATKMKVELKEQPEAVTAPSTEEEYGVESLAAFTRNLLDEANEDNGRKSEEEVAVFLN